MRAFLSEADISFEYRNIALEPRWADDLRERLGEVRVPVLIAGDQTIVGFDEEQIRKSAWHRVA